MPGRPVTVSTAATPAFVVVVFTSGSNALSKEKFTVEVEHSDIVTFRCYLLLDRYEGKRFGCIVCDVTCPAGVFKDGTWGDIVEGYVATLPNAPATALGMYYSKQELLDGAEYGESLISSFEENANQFVKLIGRKTE